MGLARAISTAHTIARQIEEDRIVEIVDLARQAALADSDVPPRPGDVIWYAIREAMDTLGRLPDREAGWLYALRGSHPEVALDHREQLEAFETMVQRLRMGEVAYEEIDVRRPPSPKAISRMEVVFDWHRHLKGKARRRDWKILGLLGSGMPAARVAKIVRTSRQTVYFQRESQCAMIAKAIADDYGTGIFAGG